MTADTGATVSAPMSGGLTLLGAQGVVCEGDVCAVPGAEDVSAE